MGMQLSLLQPGESGEMAFEVLTSTLGNSLQNSLLAHCDIVFIRSTGYMLTSSHEKQ
jgi:hypothetical protein